MTEIRILAGSGMLGSGFRETSLERGLSREPHFIGCDAGSTDGGAAALGTGETRYSKSMVKRDLSLLLRGARRLKVPLIIGSAGGAGGDIQVDWLIGVVHEIAAEFDLHFKMAAIYSEQDRAYLKERLASGHLKPLNPHSPVVDDAAIDRAAHIVGMMGAEPFMAALDDGAEVIIAGRSSDTSIYAAYPLLKGGYERGIVWHAAKMLECGSGPVERRLVSDSMFCRLNPDHFILEPVDENSRCTPRSVATQGLHENTNPYLMQEPSGMLDTRPASYEAVTDRNVRVSGSTFHEAETYTIKLEGAEFLGEQAVVVTGMRDPYFIENLDGFLESVRAATKRRITDIYGPEIAEGYHVYYRVYGVNGVMGPLEPLKDAPPPHEVGLLMEVTAPTQDLAYGIAQVLYKTANHHNYGDKYTGSVTPVARPYSKTALPIGPAYRFCLDHVVEPRDPHEMFRTTWETV